MGYILLFYILEQIAQVFSYPIVYTSRFCEKMDEAFEANLCCFGWCCSEVRLKIFPGNIKQAPWWCLREQNGLGKGLDSINMLIYCFEAQASFL